MAREFDSPTARQSDSVKGNMKISIIFTFSKTFWFHVFLNNEQKCRTVQLSNSRTIDAHPRQAVRATYILYPCLLNPHEILRVFWYFPLKNL